MRGKDNMRTAAEVLVDQLRIHGVQHVFCVPGESYLAVLDAFHDSDLAVTVCRQEGGAGMMAEAVGKATGRPGVCFVTRGPGATNASPGIHIARQDSTPLVHVRRPGRARHARARGVSGTRLPRGVRLDDQMGDRDRRSGACAGDRLARLSHRGEWPAWAGRRRHPRRHADRARRRCRRAAIRADRDIARPSRDGEVRADACRGARADLAARRQPLVAGRLRRASAALRKNTPCRSARRSAAAHLFDHAASLLRRRSRHRAESEAARAHQVRRISSSWSAAGSANCRRRAIRCSIFRGRRCRSCMCIRAPKNSAGSTARNSRSTPRRPRSRRRSTLSNCSATGAGDAEAAHADYLAWTEKPTEQPGGVNFGAVMVWLRENLAADAILCNGAGNYAAWIHRFFRFRRFGQHVAPAAGSMGYGVPAAVAMKRLYPDRPIVCLAGDGDFLMNGQEFATAVQYGSAVRHRHRRQRHVRHHPHASGARISGPRFGDRIAQSGLSGLCPRLRRLWRLCRAHRGFSGGVQGRRRPRASRRSFVLQIDPEAITPRDDAVEDPRQIAGGEKSLSAPLPESLAPLERHA